MKQKYFTLFSLYLAQSLPMSFFTTVVPIIMRQEQFSLQAIGMLQLVKLPWILKFLWAPIVDNHSRDKKSLINWILISELFYALIMVIISFFSLQVNFGLIIILFLFAVLASSTQDIATDIFAIRILKQREKPIGNSIQAAGGFIGSLIGTGVLLLVYQHIGWQVLLWILAAIVLLALLPLLSKKNKFKKSETIPVQVKFKDIFSFFQSKRSRKRLLLLIFYFSGLTGIMAMLKPYLVDLGYDIVQIGFISGIVGSISAAVASMLGGVIIKKLGRRNAFFLFTTINLLVGIYFFWIAGTIPSEFTIYLAVCSLWAAYGFSMVIIFTSAMDEVRERSEGTDFALQIVITQISSLLIAVVSGKIADIAGYQFLFALQSILTVVSLLILFSLYGDTFHKIKERHE